jgi:hypothetical protein
MRPLTPIVVGSAASSAWIPLDIYITSGQLKLDLTTGGSTCQVDYTDQDPFDPTLTLAAAGQLVASGSTNSVTNFAGPVPRAIRLTVTVFVAAATLRVHQTGLTGV